MELRKHNGIWQNLSVADLAGELWLPVPEYPPSDGVYCSNMGRIKTGHTKNRGKFRILILVPNNNGYPTAQIHRNNIRRTFTVHRVVARLFIPNPDNLPEVNHKYGVKWDNRATELEWVDRHGNMQHAACILGHFSGLNSGRSKFSKDDVLNIYNASGTEREIAKKYNVSHSVVGFIKRKQSYKEVLQKEPDSNKVFNSQLTKELIIKIYQSAMTPAASSKLFGVSPATAYLIKSGKSYSHITGGKNVLLGRKRKISDDEITTIRSSSLSSGTLAAQYNLSKSSIKAIKSKRLYKWI